MAEHVKAGRERLPVSATRVSNAHQDQNESEQTPTQKLPDLPGGYTSTSTRSTTSASPNHNRAKPREHVNSKPATAHPDRKVPTSTMDHDHFLEIARCITDPGRAKGSNSPIIDFSLLDSVASEPPVTQSSLSELDLMRIMYDPKLRHDLNFEQDVSFRPNYDGERGRQKKTLSKDYWTALAVEFAFYMQRAACQDSASYLTLPAGHHIPWRLPQMFSTIRRILQTLVRSEDTESIEQVLDVDLLMQQLNRGVCDLIGLGDWLGVVLKGSCSPVRDAFITMVVNQIRDSVMNNDPCGLSSSIEQLFGVLETMKLVSLLAPQPLRSLNLSLTNARLLGRRESPDSQSPSSDGC